MKDSTRASLLVGTVLTLMAAAWLSFSGASAMAGAQSGGIARPHRAIWVTRWDYRAPEDVLRVMNEVQTLGVTDVIWQVRGQADAYYRSELEPWGEELAGGSDPGFDPLELAIEEAHRRGMKLHAWFNVVPLWKGKTEPKDPSHPLLASPRWRVHGADGKPQPLHDGYVVVNPALPEVQNHIVRVARDIIMRYDVDGLHMDYVRFMSITAEQGIYPADDRSLRLMRADPRMSPDAGADAMPEWLAHRITDLVQRIRGEAVILRSDVEFSAAVWRNPKLGREVYLQNSASWLSRGVLDRAYPMIYFDDTAKFMEDLEAWRRAADGKPLSPGIAVYKHDDPAVTIEQMNACRKLGGFALFAYASMFESVDPNQPKDSASIDLRKTRRHAVGRHLRELAKSR